MHYVNKDYSSALKYFEKCIHISPDDFYLLNKAGALNAILLNFEQSNMYYEKALRLKPNYIRVMVNQGINLSHQVK